MKSKNVFSSRSINWSLMDQKVGDWFLEQGVKGEKGKLSHKTLAQYLHKLSKKLPPPPKGVKGEKGKVSQKTLVQNLQKSSKNSLPQQQSSNINFNLSCTMQFPILTLRLGWNNSTKLQHIMIFQFLYLSFKSIKCMFACLLHKLHIQVAEVFRVIITITILCR